MTQRHYSKEQYQTDAFLKRLRKQVISISRDWYYQPRTLGAKRYSIDLYYELTLWKCPEDFNFEDEIVYNRVVEDVMQDLEAKGIFDSENEAPEDPITVMARSWGAEDAEQLREEEVNSMRWCVEYIMADGSATQYAYCDSEQEAIEAVEFVEAHDCTVTAVFELDY